VSGDAAEQAKKFKTLSPGEAARQILDAMERDAYRVTVGRDATFMDRLSRLAPKRAAALIYSQMRELLKK
jgi:hypothetical protein